MGIGTALAVLVAGGTRGYRVGQELQRRLAEAERRMRIEEEQLALQKSEAASLNELRAAQAEGLRAGTEETKFGTGEKRRVSEKGQAPLKSPFTLGRLPINTLEDLSSAGDYMDYLSSQEKTGLERYEIEQRLANPEAFSGARRQYLDPEDQAFLDYVNKFVSTPSEMEVLKFGIDEALAKRRQFAEKMIRESNRPKLRAMILGDSTATGGNRFQGK